MVAYLSQEYLDLQRELSADFPERPGASARLQYVVTSGPAGEIRYRQVVEDGAIVENQLGDDDAPDVTMLIPWAESVQIATGELDANAAFMQGKVKVTGNIGKVMSLLPLTQSPEYKAIAERLHAATDYA